jgi:hypothetical protein
MDKLQLTGQNLGQVFNFRSGHLHAATFLVLSVKLPNLQLKTWPKQLLGYLPIVIALLALMVSSIGKVALSMINAVVYHIALQITTVRMF